MRLSENLVSATRVGAAILAVALAAALLTTARPAHAADPLAGLPSGASIIGRLDLAVSRTNPDFRERLLKMQRQVSGGGDARFMTALKAAGIDLEKDVDTVAFGAYFRKAAAGAEPNVIAIVRGRFDDEKVLTAIDAKTKENGGTVVFSEIENTAVMTITEPGPQSQPGIVTLPDDKTIILASAKAPVAAAIKGVRSGASPALSTELRPLRAKVKNESSIWAIGRLPDPPPVAPGANPSPQAIVMSGLRPRDFAFSIDGANGLNLDLALGYANADAAIQATGSVTGVLTFTMLAVMQSSSDPGGAAHEMARLKNKLITTTQGRFIRIKADYTEDEFSELARKLETVARMRGGPMGLGPRR